MRTKRFDHLKQDFYDAELVERVTITCDDKNYKVRYCYIAGKSGISVYIIPQDYVTPNICS